MEDVKRHCAVGVFSETLLLLNLPSWHPWTLLFPIQQLTFKLLPFHCLGYLIVDGQMWSCHAPSTSEWHCRACSPNAPFYSLHPCLLHCPCCVWRDVEATNFSLVPKPFKICDVSGFTKGFTLTLSIQYYVLFSIPNVLQMNRFSELPSAWKDCEPPLSPKIVDVPEQLVSWAPYMCSQENFDNLWDRRQTGWNNGFAWI